MSGIQTSNDDLALELESANTKLDTLNTNVAKESKQDTAITALQTIVTNTNGLGLGDTGAASTVAVSVSSVTIIAANTDRKMVIIRNDTNNDLFLAQGATATVSSAVKLKKGDTYIEDKYVGVISGIWDSVAGGGNAQITEVDLA